MVDGHDAGIFHLANSGACCGHPNPVGNYGSILSSDEDDSSNNDLDVEQSVEEGEIRESSMDEMWADWDR